MSDYGKAIAAGAFQIERVLPGPIERVWSYIVEPDKRAQWFAGGPMDAEPGGKINFWFQHSNLSPAGEAFPEKYKDAQEGSPSEATLTKIEPPRLLVFQWGCGEVTFELSPAGRDVKMTITHRRLKDRGEMLEISGGWHIHLSVLADRLAGRERQPFWPKIAELETEYKKRLQ